MKKTKKFVSINRTDDARRNFPSKLLVNSQTINAYFIMIMAIIITDNNNENNNNVILNLLSQQYKTLQFNLLKHDSKSSTSVDHRKICMFCIILEI